VITLKFKKVFKKILSTICAILLILSTVSNCSADKLKVLFLGQSKSGKGSVVNVMQSENADLVEHYDERVGFEFVKVAGKIYTWIVSGNDCYFNMSKINIKGCDIAVICVEVGDIGNINERCQKWIVDFVGDKESVKEIILVITKVDDEKKKEMIPKNMETSVKEKFKKIEKIFITSAEKSSPYRKGIRELKEYIMGKVSVLEEEESEEELAKIKIKTADNIEKRAHHMESVQIGHEIKDEKETILLSDKVEDKKSLFDRVDKKKALGVACLVVTVSGICYCIKDKFRKFFLSDNLQTKSEPQKNKKISNRIIN